MNTHHIFNQVFNGHAVLDWLGKNGLFEMHGEANLVPLPTDPYFAQQFGMSVHNGGHLASYNNGVERILNLLRESDDYVAGEAGDQAAAQRLGQAVQYAQSEMADALYKAESNYKGGLYINAYDKGGRAAASTRSTRPGSARPISTAAWRRSLNRPLPPSSPHRVGTTSR